MANKELVEKLQSAGVSVKTHSSGVNEAEAMKALGQSTETGGDKPKSRRPRTMLRRRPKGEEAVVEATPAAEGEVAPAAVAASEVAPSAGAASEVAASEVAASAGAASAGAASAGAASAGAASAGAASEVAVGSPAEAAPTAVVVSAPPAAEAVVENVAAAEAPPVAAVVATPVETSSTSVASEAPVPTANGAPAAAAGSAATGTAPAGEPAPGAAPSAAAAPAAGEGNPSNVVRKIDPEAIKSRLAAEGRDFKPRPKRTFSRVREIRVVNDRFGGAPQMVDVTGQQDKPGRRTGATTRNEGWRDRRDARGARDLWMNPGRKRKSGKRGKGTEITQAAAHKRVVEISDHITVSDLSHQMAVKGGQVISKLMGMGMMVTVNQSVDYETAAIVAEEFGFDVKNVAFDETDILDAQPDTVDEAHLVPRAPVVTVMGHVDHGKTSLLDHIRKARVASGEAGGITQHIGAYKVATKKGDVTFLDTPGHAAFTAMRARGAQITDIVILMVAADDGVMPQTREAIDHAKAAGVPLIVAINKCDKADAKPERVMQELTEYQLVPEDWGGETMMVQISALKGTGIEALLEAVSLQSEMLELKADPTTVCKGTVVEAQLDKGRGPVATILIEQGSLKPGQFIVAGEHAGKVRAMYDSAGKSIKEAGPSDPVQVLGLGGVPNAGDRFDAVLDDKTAKQVADHRGQKSREEQRLKDSRVSLDDFLAKKKGDIEAEELRLVVKADVDGSAEALKQALEKLSTKRVRVNIVGSGVGTITEGDVNLAIASEAIVIGFNTKPEGKASRLASHEKVDVRTYTVIYEALDEVRIAMAGLLAPRYEESYLGAAMVQEIFRVPKIGAIAGCRVTDGKITRSAKCRVKRGDEVLHEGELSSLRRFKDDVREVGNGIECGIAVKGFTEFEAEDKIEVFELIEVKAELDDLLGEPEEEKKPTPPASTAGTEAGAPA